MSIATDNPIVIELQRVNRQTGADANDSYFVNAAHIAYWVAESVYHQSGTRAATRVVLSNGEALHVAEDARLISRLIAGFGYVRSQRDLKAAS